MWRINRGYRAQRCCNPPPAGSVSVVDGFYCLCSPGFAGPRCEQDVDDCANSLCSANSVCRDRHLVSWTFFFLLGLSVTDMYEIALKKKKKKEALMSHKSEQLRPRFKEHALSKGVNKTWIASADLHLMLVLMFETLFPVMQGDENGAGVRRDAGRCGFFLQRARDAAVRVPDGDGVGRFGRDDFVAWRKLSNRFK